MYELIKVAVNHVVREGKASAEDVLAVARKVDLETLTVVQSSLFTIFSSEMKRERISKVIVLIEALAVLIAEKSPKPPLVSLGFRTSFLSPTISHRPSALGGLMRDKMALLNPIQPPSKHRIHSR